MKLDQIDDGRAFDWGRTTDDYAKYRDIYPESYFRTLESLGFAGRGQSVLDMGTGTGVIARRICRSDLKITGIDPEINQIRKAEELSADRDIRFFCRPAEDTGLEPHSFDSIIAAQCYIYFDQSRVLGEIDRLLKPNGRFFITWFCWLPRESAFAEASEKLILKYNPHWKGADFQDDY
ncbi:MAG: class I SAM-dependent methyltransferase, partial [Spirochaetales bacterium]|nr:class I SAM-dependent methyltransferase [Spirochaetales bacterium]